VGARSAPCLRAYNAGLGLASVLALPLAVLALLIRPRWRVGLAERFGRVPATPPGHPAIWVHGASVGEIAALAPVVRALRREYPGCRIVVSSLTAGGRAAAASRVPDADTCVLFPLDVPWVVARAVRAIAPRLVLFTETELWPSFLATLAAHGIPAIMVSGRVSARAFERYRRWRWLFAPALAGVRWFCVQSRETAGRLVALGAPADRIVVTGSLKAAAALAPPGALTLAGLGVGDAPVLVAGSTHPGEESALLEAWARIEARRPGARLVLAPRRPERFTEVATLLERRGVRFARRSALAPGRDARWPAGVPVLLLDTLGELAGLYAGARAAFVGGTLVEIGGHNLLEPAQRGTAVVFGPHFENARAAGERLCRSGGGFAVRDEAELAERLAALLLDDAAASAAGRLALLAAGEAEGALAVTLAVVRGTLGCPPGGESVAATAERGC